MRPRIKLLKSPEYIKFSNILINGKLNPQEKVLKDHDVLESIEAAGKKMKFNMQKA